MDPLGGFTILGVLILIGLYLAIFGEVDRSGERKSKTSATAHRIKR